MELADKQQGGTDMLIRKIYEAPNCESIDYIYEINEHKRVAFNCTSSNEIKMIGLYKDNDSLEHYWFKGLYYMENLTPEDEGEIDLIDTDKLIRMVCFDEGESC